ncbi:hypothetical protein HANVADRAFT_56122 [Hanseniaspora valbyensis NRRL Y-1626]|uniref:Mannosyltransferase n=1 Tax=Hanseniaspora valbyensis NRRL Y-1626 TaxID=766949 RepID=A0A1B7TE16_9ASCO|nr:hypothetical protein HANVADRAFT_56122 [Hanseniaspora valbyensis NRRL Y-1626]
MAGVRKNKKDESDSKLIQRKSKKQLKNSNKKEEGKLEKEIDSKEDTENTFLADELENIHQEEEKIINDLSLTSFNQLSFYINILFFVRIGLAPVFNIIQDCDETFNFIEPLNYMLRNFGKQTWEYSPEYGIRSWFYLLPYYNILSFGLKIINRYLPIWSLFYLLRVVLGFLMFKMESSLAVQLGTNFNLDLSKIYLILTMLNSGIFHAGIELLPSSFALYCITFSINNFLKYKVRSILSDKKSQYFNKTCFCILVGGIMGWPFVLVLGLPYVLMFVFEYRNLVQRTPENSRFYNIFFNKTILKVIKYFIPLVAVVTFVDSQIYAQLSPVFFNIVYYNVFNADEKSGPSIFGVEPWHYYLTNLILNFPIVTLAGCGLSLVGVLHWEILQIVWPIMLQFIIWVVVFIAQPHKEERFLYPVYSHIVLMASFTVFFIYTKLTSLSLFNSNLKQKILKFSVISLTFLQTFARIYANYYNYSATFDVYKQLDGYKNAHSEDENEVSVCVGREWYHYPGSFFLPDNFRLRFIKSNFDGLLPGDFPEVDESANITNWIDGAKLLPKNMNKYNLFEEDKVVGFDTCDYLVDINLPYGPEEAQYINFDIVEPVYCGSIINPDNSKILGRAFAFPLLSQLSDQFGFNKFYKAKFDDYCLFKINKEE